jgi:hypothetical protein
MLRLRFWLQHKLGILSLIHLIVKEQHKICLLTERIHHMEHELTQTRKDLSAMRRQLESSQCIMPERDSRLASFRSSTR